jgi:type II secretory pathway component PulF
MKYQYKAKDKTGKLQHSEIEADSIADARQKLRSQGLFVLELAAAETSTLSGGGHFSLRRVSKSDLLMLMSQLTIMCQSGVDLAESLRNLAQQCPRPSLKAVLERVYADVSSGVSFSAALKRHPNVFDEAFVAGIAAGECSGTITAVLERLTYLIRGEIRLRSTVWSMLMYPIVLCSVTFVVLNAMVFFVLPQFAKVFEDLGREPPPLTQFLLSIGAFARDQGLVILGGCVVLALAIHFARRTAPARQAYDYFMLNAALVRNATRALATGRIFRLLGTMLQSGVPLVDCIRLCRDASRNGIFRRLFDSVEQDVLNGQGVAKALFAVSFLPNGAAHMVSTAERSGRLGQVLQTVGEFYEDEGERHLRDMIKILEPAIILSLGVIVAVVVLSVVLPLLDVSTMSN